MPSGVEAPSLPPADPPRVRLSCLTTAIVGAWRLKTLTAMPRQFVTGSARQNRPDSHSSHRHHSSRAGAGPQTTQPAGVAISK